MLHHVSLEVPPGEIARSLEFWAALGFRPVGAPGDVAPFVSWVEREGTQVHLIHTPEATVPLIGHAAVVAPDFDEAVERLRVAGFEVEPARRLWDEPRAFALAPGGHRVEVMRAPPPPA